MPVDSRTYASGTNVTVLGNPGGLVKTGYTFIGWNTTANGSGSDRIPGSTFVMGNANVTLYARWTADPTYTVSYDGNGNTGGTVPIDSNAYLAGTTITIHNNTGGLANAGYSFIGWNTAPDGSGINRPVGSTFTIDNANVTLYAKWEVFSLQKIGSWKTPYGVPGFPGETFVSGNYLYCACEAVGLKIFDITNPSKPVYVGQYITNGRVYGVYIYGSYAYLLCAQFNNICELKIVDISQPTNPILVGSCVINATASGYGLYISGSYAYVDGGGAPTLQIIYISNPSNPVLLGAYSELYMSGRDVFVSGSYAYLASDSGLQIIDISNPAKPVRVDNVRPGGCESVYVIGSYAYLADSARGLIIVDIRNPIRPVCMTQGRFSGFPIAGVFVSGSYAYLTGWYDGLQIVDISNPASPALVGTYGTSSKVKGIYVSGSYAYLAVGESGLLIVDASKPANPSLAGSYDTSAYAYDVHVSSAYAYVADCYTLQVINVADPAHPVLAGDYATNGHCFNVFTTGTSVYVTNPLSEEALVIFQK